MAKKKSVPIKNKGDEVARTIGDMNPKEFESFKNSMTEMILGFNPGSLGTQVNQVDTLQISQRWYMISNMRQLLSQAYVEKGIIQTLIDVPVDDALRGGLTINTKQLDPDEIRELLAEMEQEGDLAIAGQAVKWNRLFGGGGILIITDQPADTEFEIEKIKEDSPLEFKDFDLWELFGDQQYTGDEEQGKSEIVPQLGDSHKQFNFYGKKVDRSRVMLLKGRKAPSFVRPRLRGWGLSEVEKLVQSLNQYLKAINVVFEVLDEFKIDVYKFKNLANVLMKKDGMETIQKRVSMTNKSKNFQTGLALDAEDDFIQKELAFAGIAETMIGIRMQIASDMRFPLTKLFGISAAGFSSGEDDIENYNSMVESEVRAKIKPHLLKMVKVRCQKKFGMIPDDLTLEFQSLRTLSSEQEENVKNGKFTRVASARAAGEITALEYRDAINKDKLLPIHLDTDQSALDEIENQKAEQKERDVTASAAAGPKSQLNAPDAKNSMPFDSAEYEAEGGEQEYAGLGHEATFATDSHIMKRAEDEAKKLGKSENFKVWLYKKFGGKFK